MVKIFLNQIQSAAGLTLFTTNNAGDPEYFAANTASRVIAVNSAGNAFELKSYANWDTAFSWGNHAAAGYITAATAAATYVPYTGASGNVNLGEYGIAGGFFSFDTTPTTYTPAVGRLGWNDTDGSLELTLKGGNVVHKVGETSFARVYNDTGSSIPRGSVVYVAGSSGQRLKIALADADTEATSKNTFGFAAETIGINSEGFVIVGGTIGSMNTSGYADGDTVYLSSTAGGYTNVMPTQPTHIVILGFVVKGGSSGAGSIFVKVNNGYEIDELHNVLISSVQPNDIIYYDSGTQLWKNASIASKIATNSITTSMMSQIATSSFLGRVSAGTGNVEVLTSAQATSILDLFSTTSTTKGLVPGSNNLGNTYFLRADGTWAVPAGGGSGTVTSVDLSMPTGFAVSNNPVTTSGTLTVTFASGYSLPTNTSQSNWDTAYSWGNHASAGYYVGTSTTIRQLLSSTATGLTYTNTTGVFSLTSGYVIPTTTEQSNWNTAYGWGNHASAGYLTSIANNSITDAMLRTSAAYSVIGRSANTSGNVADITAANNYEILRRSGTTLAFGSIDLSQSGAVGSSRLAYANLAQGAALSVLGVAGNLANDVASINAASDHHTLRRSGTTLGFGTLNAAAMNATYSAGQYLTTDASGNLSWATVSGSGLSYFTESRNTSSPNATIPAHALTASGTETNIDFVIVPKGTGALLVDIPDGAAAGGNKRGSNAVDLQVSRAAATRVASGANSGILSGTENTCGGARSVVAGGTLNNISAAGGSEQFIGAGSNNSINTTNDQIGIVAGDNNIGAGARSFIGAGQYNRTNADYSAISGGRYGITNINGQSAFAPGNRFASNEIGCVQRSEVSAFKSITGTSAAYLAADGNTARLILSTSNTTVNNRAWTFRISLLAVCKTTGGSITAGDVYGATYEGVIKRIGTTTSLVGTVQTVNTWSDGGFVTNTPTVSITHDDTNEALDISWTTVGGDASTVVRVNATLYLTEIGW